jgi:hypothetical protein
VAQFKENLPEIRVSRVFEDHQTRARKLYMPNLRKELMIGEIIRCRSVQDKERAADDPHGSSEN